MSEQVPTKKKVSKPKPYRYNREEKAAALEAARLIMNGFGWHLTREGDDYWQDVYINLTKIAGREP